MISIVIPTYNRAADLAALLTAVLRTSVGEREVIVVDDGSTDDTASVVARFPGVRRLAFDRNRGPSAARNAGTAAARGDVVVFLDTDVALPEGTDVLAEMERLFRDRPGVDCVCAPSDIEPAVRGIVAYNAAVYHAYYMDRLFGGRDRVEGRIMFFTSRLGGVRRATLRRAGGFYETLTTVMNEDGEYGTRLYHLGAVTIFDRRLTHGHRYPTRFTAFARGYFRTAMVQAFVDRKYDTRPDPSISRSEMARRLWTAGGLAALPAFFLSRSGAVAGLLWAAVFFASFGSMGRLVWRHVPAGCRAGWYFVYIAVTPAILAGYAWGLLRAAAGRSLLKGEAPPL